VMVSVRRYFGFLTPARCIITGSAESAMI
jgi:hypothetical protein